MDTFHFNGVEYKLGNFPSPYGYRVSASRPLPKIDIATIRPFEYPESVVQIKDQGQYGACCGHAAASSLEWARWIANPTSPYQSLSAWFVYANLCGGIDRGASISEALQFLIDNGTCLDGSVPHGTINPRRLTDPNKQEASRFKIEVGQKLTTYDQMVISAALGQTYNASVCVGSNFTNLDSNGVAGFSRGMGNHAVCGGLGLKKGPDGDWLIKFQNSWTRSFGVNGFFWISRRHVEQQGYFDCYNLIAVESDPQDPDRPPVLN